MEVPVSENTLVEVETVRKYYNFLTWYCDGMQGLGLVVDQLMYDLSICTFSYFICIFCRLACNLDHLVIIGREDYKSALIFITEISQNICTP